MENLLFTPWFWLAVGLILAALEIFVSGVFLIWFGIASVTLGIILWFVPMGAAMQLGALAILGLSYAFLGHKYLRDSNRNNKLNQRTQQMVGQKAVLIEAIRYGQGRIRLGDTEWKVTGPDLPEGTEVEIIEAVGLKLVVQEAKETEHHDLPLP